MYVGWIRDFTEDPVPVSLYGQIRTRILFFLEGLTRIRILVNSTRIRNSAVITLNSRPEFVPGDIECVQVGQLPQIRQIAHVVVAELCEREL